MDYFLSLQIAFSALTLFVGCQKKYQACKKVSDKVLAWLSDLYVVQLMSLPSPSSLASLKSRMVLSFCCQLTKVVKRRLVLSFCHYRRSRCHFVVKVIFTNLAQSQ